MDKTVCIQISGGAFLMPAVLLLFLPIQWVFSMVVAAAIHELCHIAAIWSMNGRIFRISIGMRGAQIETETMHPFKELICALAGPLGSALLLLTSQWFPRLAICGAVHFMYNCLPLLPFDGGRILRNLMVLLFPPARSEQIWQVSHNVIRGLLAAAVLFLAVKYGWVILLFGIVLLKSARRKTSCQQTLLAIQ